MLKAAQITYDSANHLLCSAVRTNAGTFGGADGSGVSNVYDALSRTTSTTDSNGRTLAYPYDAAGDRTRLNYADGGANALAVQYAYDNLQWVTTITENGSGRLKARA